MLRPLTLAALLATVASFAPPVSHVARARVRMAEQVSGTSVDDEPWNVECVGSYAGKAGLECARTRHSLPPRPPTHETSPRPPRRACGRASIPPEITAAAAAELKAKAEKTKKAHADDKGQGGAPKEKEVPQGKGWGMPMKPVPRSIAVVHDNSR